MTKFLAPKVMLTLVTTRNKKSYINIKNLCEIQSNLGYYGDTVNRRISAYNFMLSGKLE